MVSHEVEEDGVNVCSIEPTGGYGCIGQIDAFAVICVFMEGFHGAIEALGELRFGAVFLVGDVQCFQVLLKGFRGVWRVMENVKEGWSFWE